jgi:hypothetical protein
MFEVAAEAWQRLKALRSHRSRLLNKTSYPRLHRGHGTGGDTGKKNAGTLLETGLRNIMERRDLDDFDNDGLKAAPSQVADTLAALCVVLEDIVNTDLLTKEISLVSHSEYPKLDSLLGLLTATRWSFVMVSGSGWKLFQTTEPGAVEERIERFNLTFNDLAPPVIGELRNHNSGPATSDAAAGSHDQSARALKPLQHLLSRIIKISSCKGCHDVFLQLPEWDDLSKNQRFADHHLDLYLSSCCKPSRWHQSRLQKLVEM